MLLDYRYACSARTAVICLIAFFLASAGADTGLSNGDDLQRFVTRPDLMPPKWDITYHDRKRVAPGYWFVAPYSFSNNHLDDLKWVPCEVGPMIFDNDGELVWSGACQFDNRISFDFGVAQYKGKTVLKGNLVHANFPKHDCGAGYFLNSQYELEHSVLMAEDVDKNNQHEFNVEDDGKRIMIIAHDREQLDAKDLGLDGDVWVRTDGFRELETETGEVLFDWKTQDYISLNESSFRSPADEDGPRLKDFDRRGAWDAYHANAATKNLDGDYLYSIRHTDTMALISGKDGHVIWRCGGKMSDFTFEGDAIFSRQHDVRYLEHTSHRSVVTLMDNAIGDMQQDSHPATHEVSRGLILELIHKAGEPFVARRLKHYLRPDGKHTDRRGSFQILPNSNVFIAWTDAGYLSEHTDDDEVLMEARWLKESRFGTYRGYKFDNWVGEPDTLPDVKVMGYAGPGDANTVVVYVSWNGATEVRWWKFFANGQVIGLVEKSGFETAFATLNVTDYVSVQALDANKESLSRSDDVAIEWVGVAVSTQSSSETAESIMADFRERTTSHPAITGVLVVLSLVGCFAILRSVLSMMLKSKHRLPWHTADASYKEIPMDDVPPR